MVASWSCVCFNVRTPQLGHGLILIALFLHNAVRLVCFLTNDGSNYMNSDGTKTFTTSPPLQLFCVDDKSESGLFKYHNETLHNVGMSLDNINELNFKPVWC